MQSRLLINLGLLLACIGLALFLINTGEEEPATPDVPLTALDPAGINTIHIYRKLSSSEIIFTKENGKWHMQQPYQLPANEFRIHTLLKLLQAYSYTHFSKTDIDLKRFLLDAPVVSVEFNGTRIYYGDKSPLGDQRYVLVNDTVHLINDSLFEQLQTAPAFFLSNRLLPEGAAVTRIILPDREIIKQEEFWSVQPDTGISADQITQTLQAWRNTEAVSIRDYEKGESSGVIKIELEGQTPLEFIIVSPPPQLILARPDLSLQYHISGDDAKQLFLHAANEDSDKTSPQQSAHEH